MAVFPPSPVSPAEFLEGYLADAFAAAEVPEALRDLDLAIGLRLVGEGGGEWLVRLQRGALAVGAGPRDGAGLTLVQSVDDWRSGLWEGRGGAVAERALALFRPGGLSGLARRAETARPGLFQRLAGLDGMVRAVVTGGPAGDWSTAVKFGPGAIPEEATVTLSVNQDDAAALARRELGPVEAFLAGRIGVSGDMLLVMQLQAIVMRAG